ncbi:YchF/TatD family DNA exonuclease [Candidatus Desantisbacteria bacterium]|nr:YchF/TatD family DNA exonuclease [Candidatus Desantisbacteria bacterium]
MYFDSHVHLDDSIFDPDRDTVINTALSENVKLMLNIGLNTQSSIESVKLSEKYDFIYASCGFHPHDANKMKEEDYIAIRELLLHKKAIAVGEVGLDYYRNLSPVDKQREVFARFIRLAREVKKPLIIHSREAFDDTLKIMEQESAEEIGGVAHCFSGDIEIAKKFMDMNFHISFAGQITFKKNENINKLISYIPMERILIETDCPYLSPQPERGKRNMPAYVKYTAQKLAEIKMLSSDDIGRITALNAIKLFNLPIQQKPVIVYPIRDSLYLNITNQCSNSCFFCLRYKQDFLQGHLLKFNIEPTVDDLLKEIKPVISKYREVVFCGYGEPLLRIEVVLKIAAALKNMGVKHVRIDTNVHGYLMSIENIVPKFSGIIDEICISLNALDKNKYMQVCCPEFGEGTFDEVMKFILECKKVIPKVVITFVELPDLDLDACRKLAQNLGVAYKIRKFDVVG